MKWAILVVSAVLVVGFVAGWFYWYQWKPSKVRETCNKTAIETEKDHTTTYWQGFNLSKEDAKTFTDKGYDYNTVYTQCLRAEGLK